MKRELLVRDFNFNNERGVRGESMEGEEADGKGELPALMHGNEE